MSRTPALRVLIMLCLLVPFRGRATEPSADLAARVAAIEADVIAWRRDIHQHPELSNREARTAALVADHLRALGFDAVHTGIAHTGVVGVLVGGRPGATVALRADMDALPVEEPPGLPFASTVRAEYNGEQVPVMHACGHDAHTAMLMGAASVLAALRAEIPGTIAFVFQPAEEGAPQGEEGGAKLMLKEGLLDLARKPAAIFGLHVWPGEPNTLAYRTEGAMAASDRLRLEITGRQTHGSSPWTGVDPIIVSAQIMNALQVIPSRQLDVTRAPSVITIGSIHGGIRPNIIPDKVEMLGTLRNFDARVRAEAHARIRRTAEGIAAAAGATAHLEIREQTLVTWNDPALAARMRPALEKAAPERVLGAPFVMAGEDFSYYQQEIPGLFVFLGINAPGADPDKVAINHSPHFMINEDALKTGVHALAQLALDYLAGAPPTSD
ncbi:MAG: amidohydrolase [Gammaproteobacteria bacterium]